MVSTGGTRRHERLLASRWIRAAWQPSSDTLLQATSLTSEKKRQKDTLANSKMSFHATSTTRCDGKISYGGIKALAQLMAAMPGFLSKQTALDWRSPTRSAWHADTSSLTHLAKTGQRMSMSGWIRTRVSRLQYPISRTSSSENRIGGKLPRQWRAATGPLPTNDSIAKRLRHSDTSGFPPPIVTRDAIEATTLKGISRTNTTNNDDLEMQRDVFAEQSSL